MEPINAVRAKAGIPALNPSLVFGVDSRMLDSQIKDLKKKLEEKFPNYQIVIAQGVNYIQVVPA